ncbi:MAG TPA: phytanoyl-CoA dioxygenase family protein [Abditibacteriaceae bacterium]|nr:phytanoyl-CoA dioxygenase family protein [Abditibacteriaceae bacterium]
MKTRTLETSMESEARQFFDEHGYYVARGLFSAEEVAHMRDHFMELRKQGPTPGDMGGDPKKHRADPLNQFPRFINMHDWDALTAAWQQDPRFTKLASELVGDDVALCQTMLYFKPPGARGQGLHQDNQYIRKYPIIAAWLALDRCDAANGQMIVVPGSNKLGILPVQPADMERSFTNGATVIPEGAQEIGIDMEAGDILFFGGFTIHGSYPNQTADRFRRTFIVHYFAAHTEELPADPATSMAGLAA